MYPYDCASYVARARSIDRERERVEGFLENGLSVIGGRGEQSANQKKVGKKLYQIDSHLDSHCHSMVRESLKFRYVFGSSISLNGASYM